MKKSQNSSKGMLGYFIQRALGIEVIFNNINKEGEFEEEGENEDNNLYLNINTNINLYTYQVKNKVKLQGLGEGEALYKAIRNERNTVQFKNIFLTIQSKSGFTKEIKILFENKNFKEIAKKLKFEEDEITEDILNFLERVKLEVINNDIYFSVAFIETVRKFLKLNLNIDYSKVYHKLLICNLNFFLTKLLEKDGSNKITFKEILEHLKDVFNKDLETLEYDTFLKLYEDYLDVNLDWFPKKISKKIFLNQLQWKKYNKSSTEGLIQRDRLRIYLHNYYEVVGKEDLEKNIGFIRYMKKKSNYSNRFTKKSEFWSHFEKVFQ